MSTDDSALGAGTQPEVTTTDNSGAGPQQDDNNKDNPAWGEILEALPTSLHGVVKPHLAKWDQGVQQRFQQVQSQYSPYKQFVDNNVSADDLSSGYQLVKMISENPRDFYDRMTEFYGEEWGLNSDQGRDDGNEWVDPEDEDGNDQPDPIAQQLEAAQQELAAMKGNQDTIANYLAGQVEAQVQQEANQEIEKEFTQITEKYGELDQQKINLIVSLAVQNKMSATEAADQVFSLLGAQQQQARPAPRVVPTNGGIPQSPPINPGKLAPKDRRSLVASILEANHANE